MTTSSLIEMAERLSEAQRKAVLGDPDRLEATIADLMTLCLRGIADVRPDNTVLLTPLGLAVRDVLRARASQGGE